MRIGKNTKPTAGRQRRVSKRAPKHLRLGIWLHHRKTRVRAANFALALLFAAGVFIQTAGIFVENGTYKLSSGARSLVGTPSSLLAASLKFDPKAGVYEYNKDYRPGGGEVAGRGASPKFSASFNIDPEKGTTVTDPVTKTAITFKPQFDMRQPKQDQNRLLYPLKGKNAVKVISLKSVGFKEDIILNKYQGDELEFGYVLELPAGTEARMEKNGSLAIYGADYSLLGDVSVGGESDQKLLEAARQNAVKRNLLFTFPAPFIKEHDKKIVNNNAWFTLEGSTLTVHAKGLKDASYPLTIDPSIYIETAAKLMRGNNETNTDFDVDKELIQKSQTTGARIDEWTSTNDLSSAVWGQGTATAGGYIYTVGGQGGNVPTTTTYYSAGSNTFNVPAGVTSITVKTWGGGGGGAAGSGSTGRGGHGGGGGYSKAVISVTPSESLDVDVGTGGAKGAAASNGGDGGGYSALRRGGTFLLQAGGGAGGGGTSGSGVGGQGGAGGGTSGANGVAGTGGSVGGSLGNGGTTTTGGTGGAAGTGGTAGSVGAANGGGNAGGSGATCSTAVTNTQGGAGGTGAGGRGGTAGSCSGGGGGGGGRFGGGGSGSTSNASSRRNGGGGGGSSLATGSAQVQTVGSSQTPGNDADADRNGAGQGGTGATTFGAATAGGDGAVVISYVLSSGSSIPTVQWARFNTSSSVIESPNPGNGICSGWCTNSVYDLPAARYNLSLIAYNGYLYAIGGQDSSCTTGNGTGDGGFCSTVYIAKLGANGEPQLWHPSGGTPVYWHQDAALSAPRSSFGAVAYNNYLYILGGLTTSNAVISSDTVQFASINPMGTLTSWDDTGMSALSPARYGVSAQTYNGVLYVMGGSTTFTGAPVSTVEYAKLNSDGTMNAWKATNSLATSGRLSMGGSFSAILGGYIYVGGGCTTLNGSGYCTAIASDLQLASINADGSLAQWGTILNLTNTRMGHTLIAWQNGLYRLGGCRAQDSSTGTCTDTVFDVDYGVVNDPGDASTVGTSVTNSEDPCNSGTPTSCNLPSASVGNLLNATAILNGYLYIMGGCTTNDCGSAGEQSQGVVYQAVNSDGTLGRPATCLGTYVDSYCVSSSSLPVVLAAPGVAIFGGRIYVVGGFPTISNIYYVNVNDDGSLGAWQDNDVVTGTTTAADAVSYTFAYARANPSSAGTNPGNLFIFGGCSGTITNIGCSGYSEAVYKCNITTSGSITGCATSGQLQIGAIPDSCGTGLGAMAAAVYANYIYLMGGLSPNCTDLTGVRYAKFDDSNNVVTVGSGWVQGTEEMKSGRRRGSGFGYNGYLYVMGGYDGADAIADIEFAKINVSDGSWEEFDRSQVTIQKRWALSTVISNSYAYVIGGCIEGPAPTGCTTRTNTIQTFQIYNNNSGAPAQYTAATNLFGGNDRLGASAAVLNGYIYVAGGCTTVTAGACTAVTADVQYASLDAYGAVGTWATTTDPTLPQARAFGQLEAAGGTLYYIGGQESTATNESAEVYWGTPSAGNVSSWADAANDLLAARTQHGAAVWNNRIYVTGGLDGSAASSNVIYASPQLNSGGDISTAWTSTGMTAFDVARSGHVTIAYANNLYVFGGYDGTNYLSDSQYTQINTDGTLDAWTFTTSLPSPLRQADGFAINGYMYLFGGRTEDAVCAPKTLIAPISANTIIDPDDINNSNLPTGVGEWYETNARYSGNRYGGAAVHSDGKAYLIGGGCETFPVVNSVTSTVFDTNTNAHNVNMPATVDANDLLIGLFTSDENPTVTVSGWTQIGTTAANGTALNASVWAKLAAGTEDGTTVNFNTSSTQQAAAQVYRIQAGTWRNSGTLGSDINISSGVSATTQTPNPPSLDPGSWGTENTLWLAYAAGSRYDSVTNYPVGYTGGTHAEGGTDTTGVSVSSARLDSRAASANPDTFTMDSSQASVSLTVAVRPAASSLSFTGADRVVQTALLTQPQVAKYSRMIDTDTDVFPNSWLMNGVDHSIGARWQVKYRSMHDLDGAAYTDPDEDCGTSPTMPQMTGWGQDTNFGDTTLGRVEQYIPKNSSGGDIKCARYYYFFISIDASQTFGYPEDVARGPTLSDISLFFTSDPSKRLRHGKTFTGGEQQPLDTPCRRGSSAPGDPNYNCPLP
jgi:hypothetical protein